MKCFQNRTFVLFKENTFHTILLSSFIILSCILTSCGKESSTDENLSDISSAETENSSDISPAENDTISKTDSVTDTLSVFDYNHEYNEIIRCYENDIYLAREDGIYRIADGDTEEKPVYKNSYRMRRGMELYQNYLYFCGSALDGDSEKAAIYRMNLDTFETENILASFDENFDLFYNISIYENKLYAASGFSGLRTGFSLDEDGNVTGKLDETAEDFLYREYNDYIKLKLEATSNDVPYDSEEYWNIVKEMNKKYIAMIDVAACKKMLNGNLIVSQYKDELYSSIFLETENGNYEFLCDYISFPSLVTETGFYYTPVEAGDIWYVDYETKTPQLFFAKDTDTWDSISLANYDADYLYLTASRRTDNQAGEQPEFETWLLRISRQDASEEHIFRFENGFDAFAINSLYTHCAVYQNTMYLDTGETINLEPVK